MERITVGNSFAEVDAAQWDALAGGDHPFLSHGFLSALEESGSATSRAGWQPLPLLLRDAEDTLVGAVPLYGKSHSQGEYIFDHSWADAWQRAGGQYYPKLLSAVPFTPAPGPRLLAQDRSLVPELIRGMEALAINNQLSSAHANFIEEPDMTAFTEAGWLLREGVQFHFKNRGYGSFDDFMETLASRKRRTIRKERAAAQAAVTIHALTGDAITEAHWDAFWVFYQDTGARKWGRPYLTRAFFSLISARMADRILLLIAEKDGQPVAGALNFIGGDVLYGRYWGCTQDIPFLHFELCYYQAIDFAIARGLSRVEAGAQGEHKIARGYEPVPTWSAHYIADQGFRTAIADFLDRERHAMERQIEFLGTVTPFRRG
ncbi:MAG TPA: GNAT family N-acetyltransferase [Chakrabartia sp.]|nr:GNAT family N-acetyltransferase [Chakrabartia sp.]